MGPQPAWPRLETTVAEIPGRPAATPELSPKADETAASAEPDAARKTRTKKKREAQDEWGMFDPEQCGFSALMAKLDEIKDTDS
jgi:hypothetical protein